MLMSGASSCGVGAAVGTVAAVVVAVHVDHGEAFVAPGNLVEKAGEGSIIVRMERP
jgi:hypothetical protein